MQGLQIIFNACNLQSYFVPLYLIQHNIPPKKTIMKRYILKFWWVLPILLFICLLGLVLSFTDEPIFLENIVGILLLLVLICLFASWVVLLINKQWGKCLLSAALSVGIICLLWDLLIIGAMTGPDGFGKKHPIPDGLDYNLPIERSESDYLRRSFPSVDVDSLDASSFLQVWGDMGVYYYDFYYGSLPAGEVFLRCYEVTENLPLSKNRLPNETTVQIEAVSSFSKLVEKNRFVISEGDWEDYYAARFEVWHRDGKTGKETKLMEKVYRVEGYMR